MLDSSSSFDIIAPSSQFFTKQTQTLYPNQLTKTSDIEVDYIGFSSSDTKYVQARAAMEYAIGIWETILVSSVPIKINFYWKDLDKTTLARASASRYQGTSPTSPEYPLALLNAQTGRDSDPGLNDINIYFDTTLQAGNSWYFGTDGKTPTNSTDFVSLAMHEIGHGLGFSTGWNPDAEGNITRGRKIYDQFIVNANGVNLNNTNAYPNLTSAILENNLVYFGGINTKVANSFKSVKLHSSKPFEPGSSISHLDDIFDDNHNNLMTHSFARGEAIHHPGALGFAMLKDLGWSVNTEGWNYGTSSDDYIDVASITSNTVTNTRIYGWSGNDILLGQRLADYLEGGLGKDELYGRKGNDTLAGGGSDDTLSGGSGNDILEGGVEEEFIRATESDNDWLSGRDGNDSLFGGAGKDTVEGGSGDDLVYLDSGSDQLDGGDGIDWLIETTTAKTSNTITRGLYVDLAGNTITDIYGNVEQAFSFENVAGSVNNDYIYGSALKNILVGGKGSDYIEGAGGDDFLFGSSGFDILYGGDGVDTLRGGEENDLFFADSGVDSIFGDTGLDRISYAKVQNLSSLGASVDLRSSSSFDGFGSIDTLEGIENVTGSQYGDRILGDAGVNSIGGAKGGDIISGRGGDDNLIGEEGNDTIYGGEKDSPGGISGSDSILGGLGNDLLEGGDGQDTIYGGTDQDTLIGDTGNDLLFGNEGADYIYIDGGDDTIDGGADAFIDIVSFEKMVSFSNQGLYAELSNASLFQNSGFFTGSDTITNIEGIVGSKYNDTLYGDVNNNDLDGGDGKDFLRGGVGDDILAGRSGDDVIYGDEGNDAIFGNEDNDFIDGGVGDDTVSGGSGSDNFILGISLGKDFILDFVQSEDIFTMVDGLSFDSLKFVQGTGDNSGQTSILKKDDNQILAVLNEVQASSLTQANFVS